ncbi:MAG TPA: metallophosphoesterase [Candidatus Omnitrophica bacterium]|nr:metallophosphoesterase [Candidatus Omnitrophota bacterium]
MGRVGKFMRAEKLPSSLKNSIRDKNSYQILALPDLHIPTDMDLKEMILQSRILKEIDHIILLGDNVACYGEEEEYRALNEFLKRLPLSYTALNGNHEFMFRLQKFSSQTYGKVWERNNLIERKLQLERFYTFFQLKEHFWSEKISRILYLFYTIGNDESEKIEILPKSGEGYLQNILKNLASSRIDKVIIFCHAPLKGSEIDGFQYYNENATPFIYLQNETFQLVEKSGVNFYWFSGHIHLNPSHPMALGRKVRENLYQVNCPPSWKFSRKILADVVPKRYEEFHSVIINIIHDKITLRLYDWLKETFVLEMEL